MEIKKFTFNPFSENTYIAYENGIAAIFDPGMSNAQEESQVSDFLEKNELKWNIPFNGSPEIEVFLKEGDVLKVGNSELRIFMIPGHSVGHLIFVNDADKIVIGGDTLFQGSIGRTDLPGGDHEQLLKNIKEKMFTLPEDCVVYSGHGPETTIGFEKQNNPWF